MATAYTTEREVPQPPVKEQRVVLELTKEEAETLLLVCNRVGGSPEGRRGHADVIAYALVSAGVQVLTRSTGLGSISIPDNL